MRHQRASLVVDVPLPGIEALLADVGRWPSFLHDVRAVRTVRPGEYLFESAGPRPRVRHVRVTHDARAHRFAWTTRRSIPRGGAGQGPPGPLRSGTLTLVAVDGDRRTRVDLCLLDYPQELWGGFADMFSGGDAHARADLLHLERYLTRELAREVVPA